MKFLIDTNVFLPLEPTSRDGIEANTREATELVRLCAQAHADVYLHPATRSDISHDQREDRREMREILFEKYVVLPAPPAINEKMQRVIGSSPPGTNDWIDDNLLAAVYGDAVDCLVTEDQRLHRKAKKLGVRDRVATIPEAVAAVRRLFDLAPMPPPAVKKVLAHEIDTTDPIFESLRKDYGPEFDNWIRKCRREHRTAWIVRQYDHRQLAGVCIVKQEYGNEVQLSGKVLKLCTFKVADEFRGNSYGELLLKAVLEYAQRDDYAWVYLTSFAKHAYLIDFFSEFGFEDAGEKTGLGEMMLAKPLSGDPKSLDALSYHVRLGPPALMFHGNSKYIVPIRPEYAKILFPEAEKQRELFPGKESFGNSIRKAYLCNAGIRKIKPGDILLFYRSRDERSVRVVGIVERTRVSSDASTIAAFVGKRTVYDFADITRMCGKDTLAILFRQDRILDNPICYTELERIGAVQGAPQAPQTFPEEQTRWLETRISMSC